MKRRLVNLLAALSLLLCLAVAVVWVRSYWVGDWVEWYSSLEEVPGTVYWVEAASGGGGLGGTFGRAAFPPLDEVEEGARPDYLAAVASARVGAGSEGFFSAHWVHGSRHGFDVRHQRPIVSSGVQAELWLLTLPYWFLFLLTAALPAFVTFRRWRAAVRDRMVGRCVACGYDLRASPQRCPECGRPVA